MRPEPPTLLVVDDEPEVLRSVHDLFRRDYRVLTFERGGEAINALERTEILSVSLSGQRMPGMTGVDLLRRAERWPTGQDDPPPLHRIRRHQSRDRRDQ